MPKDDLQKDENYRCPDTVDLEACIASTVLDNPKEWGAVIEKSAYTKDTICEQAEIGRDTLEKWIDPKKNVTPQKAKFEKVRAVMEDVWKKKKLEYHPSYGYVTEDQLKKLADLPHGVERASLLKQIAKQSKTAGKTL